MIEADGRCPIGQGITMCRALSLFRHSSAFLGFCNPITASWPATEAGGPIRWLPHMRSLCLRTCGEVRQVFSRWACGIALTLYICSACMGYICLHACVPVSWPASYTSLQLYAGGFAWMLPTEGSFLQAYGLFCWPRCYNHSARCRMRAPPQLLITAASFRFLHSPQRDSVFMQRTKRVLFCMCAGCLCGGIEARMCRACRHFELGRASPPSPWKRPTLCRCARWTLLSEMRCGALAPLERSIAWHGHGHDWMLQGGRMEGSVP